MSELIFRENEEDYDEKVIEVGSYFKCNDGVTIFHTDLAIMPKEEIIMTDCGDTYYDYSISFDTILKIAEKIKEIRKEKDNGIRR